MATSPIEAFRAAESVDMVSLNFSDDDTQQPSDASMDNNLDLVISTARTIKHQFPAVKVEVELPHLDPDNRERLAALALPCIDVISVRGLLQEYEPIDFTLQLQV